jgi:hypothetical protein
MVMRYFGGGIGHLKNTPPQQVPGFDPFDPTSEEMAVEEDEDLGTVVQQPSSDVMNGCELVQLEVNEDDDDDNDESDSDEGGDQTDEDEDEELEGEREDDYGYASA